MEQKNIIELIQNCLKGSRKSQKILFETYYSYGLNISNRYSSNLEDSKEILSQAFQRVFKNLSQYNAAYLFKNWFTRIIINCSCDFYRYSKPHNLSLLEENFYTLEDDYNVIDDLNYKEILECIQQLTPAYRNVFNMYVVDGYSHKEIAKELLISEGTSKSNLFKAKKQLQEIIGQNLGISKYSE